MRINFAPIGAKMIEFGWTRKYTCARAEISRDSLRKIEKNKEVYDTTMIQKLCITLGIKPIEVVQNVALTSTQGAENLGDGKRPAAHFNGADQEDSSR